MSSIGKKIKSLTQDKAARAVLEGKKNFESKDPKWDELAKKRAEWSKDYLVEEPIGFLQVKDSRVPALSNKMHKDCGCTAAYLFRQSIKKRPEWKE